MTLTFEQLKKKLTLVINTKGFHIVHSHFLLQDHSTGIKIFVLVILAFVGIGHYRGHLCFTNTSCFSTYNLYYSTVHFPRGSFVWNLLRHGSQRTMSSGCITLLGETHSHRVRGCLHQGETEVCRIAMSLGESLLSIVYFDLLERVYCLFWSLGESLLSIVYFDLWERVYCLFWSLGESLLSILI